MLIEDAKPPQLKRVALEVRDAEFAALLAAILASWGYQHVADPAQADLLLAETTPTPPPGVTLVRLGGERGSGGLEYPLALEELWAALEQRFHLPQRQHIRIALKQQVEVMVRHRYGEATLESLSDMGGRLVYGRELVRGEKVLLRLGLCGRIYELGGQVIYSFPRGAGGEFEVGVVFEGVGAEVRKALRRFIVQRLLASALARTQAGAEAALRCFRQP